jgi:hypothetical protein
MELRGKKAVGNVKLTVIASVMWNMMGLSEMQMDIVLVTLNLMAQCGI